MKKNPELDPEPVKTSVRLPPAVIAELKRTAKHHGRTMNDEILARVMEAEDRATFRQLVKQNDELRALMREMIERIELLK
jgi:plasmid stability protein